MSSRSRGSDLLAEPTSVEQRSGSLCVAVHRHIHYPGEWLVSCRELGFDRRSLGPVSLDEAKKLAVAVVQKATVALASSASRLVP